MNRRVFNKTLGSAVAVVAINPLFSCTKQFNVMDRIAMSTVNFRERFSQTRSPENTRTKDALTLLEVPSFFANRFQLHHVEFWSKHFESIEPTYIKELGEAIKKNNSNLINIQFDEAYELGSPDEATRKSSLELALKWLNVAEALDSDCFRVNPMNGNVDYVIEALKIINKEANKKGIILMVENHFGMEMNPDIHLKIVKAIGKNCYTLPDFGNYDDDARYASLEKIMPYAHQISAKTMQFDKNMNHLSYDFDKCMKIATDNNFKGIYSVEQWSPESVIGNEEEMADWMIAKIKKHIA